MRNKKPWATIWLSEHKTQESVFDSYRDLKKEMKQMMDKSYNDRVLITRTRRGEWGQWHETWAPHPISNKPIIIKQTWL